MSSFNPFCHQSSHFIDRAGWQAKRHLSPSPIGNLDPVDDRGSAGEGASSAILFLRMVRWCIWLTRLTLVCEVIRYRLVQVRQNLKKRLFGLAARDRLSLFLPLSFSPSSHFLSFSIQKWNLRVSHTLMASTISVVGEPEQVNLVVRVLKPDYLPLDIFLHLRSETWTQWTIETARVKVHRRPYSFWGWSGGVSG